MANRTIYVKDNEVWDNAVDIANRMDISMSELITHALRAITGSQCPVCKAVHELTRVR